MGNALASCRNSPTASASTGLSRDDDLREGRGRKATVELVAGAAGRLIDDAKELDRWLDELRECVLRELDAKHRVRLRCAPRRESARAFCRRCPPGSSVSAATRRRWDVLLALGDFARRVWWPSNDKQRHPFENASAAKREGPLHRGMRHRSALFSFQLPRSRLLRFEVAADTFATFREAMRRLQRISGGTLDDDSVLFAMARHVLGGPRDEGRSS
jgi:hypothetical protein